jgi:flagellar hook-basal body complex protein FliE
MSRNNLKKYRTGKGWSGESRRHGLARRGIETNIDEDKRLAVNKFVAKGEYYEILKASELMFEKGCYVSRIVLKRDASNEGTPWITHLQMFPDYPDMTNSSYAFGHYFTNEKSATEDFKQRLESYRTSEMKNYKGEWVSKGLKEDTKKILKKMDKHAEKTAKEVSGYLKQSKEDVKETAKKVDAKMDEHAKKTAKYVSEVVKSTKEAKNKATEKLDKHASDTASDLNKIFKKLRS